MTELLWAIADIESTCVSEAFYTARSPDRCIEYVRTIATSTQFGMLISPDYSSKYDARAFKSVMNSDEDVSENQSTILCSLQTFIVPILLFQKYTPLSSLQFFDKRSHTAMKDGCKEQP